MKKTSPILLLLAIALLATTFAACSADDDAPLPTPSAEDAHVERMIIYAVGSDEGRQTLGTEAEWDLLLDHFLDYTTEGQSVTFYNRYSQLPVKAGTTASREVTTFSTSDRQQMKDWMKEMEREGKTVNVTYDENTRTYNGMAYANAPTPQSGADCYTGMVVLLDFDDGLGFDDGFALLGLQISDDNTLLLTSGGVALLASDAEELVPGTTATLCGELTVSTDLEGQTLLLLDIAPTSLGSVVGSWRYVCLSATRVGGDDFLLSTSIYVPEMFGNAVRYDFFDDGSATLSRLSATDWSVVGSENGSWTLSSDGDLCCPLLETGGNCWNISWLSSSTMILTRTEATSEGDVYYQMEFAAEE